ncbi:MAG: c-type cytochrome domain-containing protein, partial [Planctomycetia bacterium]
MGPRAATRQLRDVLCGACAHGLMLACVASATAAAAERVDFSRDIQPLLAKRCVACHGPDTQEGGLRLDQQAGATAALDSGSRA